MAASADLPELLGAVPATDPENVSATHAAQRPVGCPRAVVLGGLGELIRPPRSAGALARIGPRRRPFGAGSALFTSPGRTRPMTDPVVLFAQG